MAFLDWNESYSVHNDEFDAHHQRLFALINGLYAEVVKQHDRSLKQQAIGQLLSELIDYGYYHFEAEEKLMIQYEYPCYENHKDEHEQFKLDMGKMMQSQQAGTLVWSFPVFAFMKDWLIFHVLGSDKEYGDFLKNKI